jgi:hypothetical protein
LAEDKGGKREIMDAVTLERLVLLHLNDISGTLCKFYLVHICNQNEQGYFRMSARTYKSTFGGSSSYLTRNKYILDTLGLTEGEFSNQSYSASILPVEHSEIGKVCAKSGTYSEQHHAILAIINSDSVPKVAHDECAKSGTLAGTLGGQCAKSGTVLKLSGDSVPLFHLHNKKKTISKSLTKTSSYYDVPKVAHDDLNNMAMLQDVLQIWDSWNAFTKQHPTTLCETHVPIRVRNDKSTDYPLFTAIRDWVSEQGPDWVVQWETFLTMAKNNTFLQGKETMPDGKTFHPTLAWLFKGSKTDPTPGIRRALEGVFNKSDLKATANLNEDGSLTQSGYDSIKQASKGMKILGEIKD